MKNFLTRLKIFLTSNKFKTFCWTVFNASVILYVAGLPPECSILIAFINMITKNINKTYNKNFKS